jgi:hypothetical protein
MSAPTFHCPACGKVYLARADAAGERFRCDCGQQLMVPDITGSDAPERPYELVPEWQPDVPAPAKHVTRVARPAAQPEPEAPSFSSPRRESSTRKWGPVRQQESGPRFDREAEFERSSRRRAFLNWSILVVVVFLMAFALVASIARRVGPVTPRTVVTSAFPNPDDEDVAQLTRDKGATELREWMRQDPKHFVLGLTPAEALKCADAWYGMGAVKVSAFGKTTTDYLAIELPDDPAKRAALFDWENRYAAANRHDGTKDEGQKYLLIRLQY